MTSLRLLGRHLALTCWITGWLWPAVVLAALAQHTNPIPIHKGGDNTVHRPIKRPHQFMGLRGSAAKAVAEIPTRAVACPTVQGASLRCSLPAPPSDRLSDESLEKVRTDDGRSHCSRFAGRRHRRALHGRHPTVAHPGETDGIAALCQSREPGAAHAHPG